MAGVEVQPVLPKSAKVSKRYACFSKGPKSICTTLSTETETGYGCRRRSAHVIDSLSHSKCDATEIGSATSGRERAEWCLEIGAAKVRRLRDNLLNITTNIQRDITLMHPLPH